MLASNRPAITEDVGNPAPDEEDGPLGYHERKVLGRCTRAGCPDDAREDGNQCQEHTDDEARRKRRTRRKKKRARALARKIWRKKKRCLGCGGKRLKGETRCTKCIVLTGRAPALNVLSDGTKTARIEAATSIDRDGRSRYRGQNRRGRQSAAAVDAKDLEYASESLRRGIDGLSFAASSVVAALPRFQRDDAKRAAEAELLQAYRFVGEVLARHGVIAPADEDEEH